MIRYYCLMVAVNISGQNMSIYPAKILTIYSSKTFDCISGQYIWLYIRSKFDYISIWPKYLTIYPTKIFGQNIWPYFWWKYLTVSGQNILPYFWSKYFTVSGRNNFLYIWQNKYPLQRRNILYQPTFHNRLVHTHGSHHLQLNL